MDQWTSEDIRKLRRMFGSHTDAKLARELGRPVAEVRAKAAAMLLAKNKTRFPGQRAMPRWTEAELKLLQRRYETTSNFELAALLGKSEKSIASKGRKLGLLKSDARLQAMGSDNASCRKDRRPDRG